MITNNINTGTEVIDVLSPNLIAEMIGDLYGRGFTRSDLAERFGVKGSAISLWRSGESYPEDSKLKLLSDLHQGYSYRELVVHKWVHWLLREKGLNPSEVREMIDRIAA